MKLTAAFRIRTAGGTDRVVCDPFVADGSTAVAHVFDTNTALANAAAKVASFRTGGTEVAAITKDGVVGATIPANLQTAAYTLVLADLGKVVELNSASAVTLTVPSNASVAFAIGTVIEVCQIGAGQVTIAAAGGVTLRSPSGKLKIAGQYSSASLRKRATNEWVVAGDLSA